MLLSLAVVPVLRARLNEKFARGAENQSLLVETITGIQTVKASALEPADGAPLGQAAGSLCVGQLQNPNLATWAHEGVNLIGKLVNAATLWFGASW
jgi:subfamily B ATP-binding cassette protein HlyB/CyaB